MNKMLKINILFLSLKILKIFKIVNIIYFLLK